MICSDIILNPSKEDDAIGENDHCSNKTNLFLSFREQLYVAGHDTQKSERFPIVMFTAISNSVWLCSNFFFVCMCFFC